jgi:uncharacterized protein
VQETERLDYAGMVIQDMRHWLEQAVIGLNLCPFAKSVHVRGQVHYVVSRATDTEQLESALVHELKALVQADPQVRDTTLLMAPDCLSSFLAFNDFLGVADNCLASLDLEGVVQIASFHPQFQFAGTGRGDIGNYTNRAPYPTLHLLREASIDRAVAAFPQAEAIFEHNIDTLRQLGREGWAQLGVQRSVPVPPEVPERSPGRGGRRRGTIR